MLEKYDFTMSYSGESEGGRERSELQLNLDSSHLTCLAQGKTAIVL